MLETAKLFQNGSSQAVRLPKAYRFQGDKVYVKRQGNAIILLPYQAPWQALIESVHQFSSDFMEERNQPSIQDRDPLFP